MATATATRTFKGLELSCPECGEAEATISLGLAGGNPGRCECADCGAEFDPADAVAKMAERLDAWRKVVRLVELAAELCGE